MEKTYNPDAIEQKRYDEWEQSGCFKAAGEGNPYCIMIPPPNVTGSLHMGHGFQYTLMDVLVRMKRMKGNDTLWQVGTDHAGIATQMVVERRLLKDNVTRHELGREAFIDKIWDWKETAGGRITQQLRRMGASVDWSRERFTMDEGLSEAVQQVFIELYREDLIYRGKRLVNWDPTLKTAISDLEVVNHEEQGSLWYMRYPIQGEEGYLVVATTRPETLFGDQAVAVHPDDQRYQSLIGKSVTLPLSGRTIPIIADTYVDPEFGTGCVKITPAHDFNDHAVGKRHDLALLTVLTPDALLNDNAPEAYQGMDRMTARKQVVDDLSANGLLEKIEPHTLKVPRGDRSGDIIEPYLTDQWFVKASELAGPAIEAVQKGKIRFIPERWNKTYYQWLENIEDWCISRQLWWGHRVPAWYDEAGKVYVGKDEADVRSHYALADTVILTQDDDVLDTWFSSALWPFSTLGWPEKTPELAKYYPTDVLVTGFDIIFFWVARMVMMGLKFMGDVPFKEVYITGLIRDGDGQKMSKSKGNVLDPLDLIDGITLDELVEKRTSHMMQPAMAEKVAKQTRAAFPDGIKAHGTDALRMTFCSLASYGREVRFDLGRLEGYRNFCNKLWNASRYVLMQLPESETIVTGGDPEHVVNQWIVHRLQQLTKQVEEAMAQYRFDWLVQSLHAFTWDELCDWYLELSKPLLSMGDDELTRETRATLVHVLDQLLKLLHPFMPYITSEIWDKVKVIMGIADDQTLMNQTYPAFDESHCYPAASQTVEGLQAIISALRTIRSEIGIPPKKAVTVLLQGGNHDDQTLVAEQGDLIKRLANIETLTWLTDAEPPKGVAIGLVGELQLLVPLAGLVDVEEEKARLNKAIGKLQKEHKGLSAKLANETFLAKAPAEVVQKDQDRLAELLETLSTLETKMAELSG